MILYLSLINIYAFLLGDLSPIKAIVLSEKIWYFKYVYKHMSWIFFVWEWE